MLNKITENVEMKSISVPGTDGDAGLPDGGIGVGDNEVDFTGVGNC